MTWHRVQGSRAHGAKKVRGVLTSVLSPTDRILKRGRGGYSPLPRTGHLLTQREREASAASRVRVFLRPLTLPLPNLIESSGGGEEVFRPPVSIASSAAGERVHDSKVKKIVPCYTGFGIWLLWRHRPWWVWRRCCSCKAKLCSEPLL